MESLVPKNLKRNVVRTLASAGVAVGGAVSGIEAPTHVEADSQPEVVIVSPPEGYTSRILGAGIEWAPIPEATQMQHYIIPFGNDGPSANLHVTNPNYIRNNNFRIARPFVNRENVVANCFTLPDMTYTYRARASSEPTPLNPFNNVGWGPWSERNFRTPTRDAGRITAVAPLSGGSVETLNPQLHWNNTDEKGGASDIFYFEIQVSKDQNFETDPAKATAAVYWELVNACAQPAPHMYYQVRPGFSLEPGTTYYWRVRPRIQGNGTPVSWSEMWNFQTPQPTLKKVSSIEDINPASVAKYMEELREETNRQLKTTTKITEADITVTRTSPNREQRRHGSK